MQYLLIENQARSLQYLLASLKWREVAREARRKEFPTAAAVYNQFIIPKEFTLFFLSTQDSFNPYKSSCTLKALCGLHLWHFPLRHTEMKNSQNYLKPRRAESSRPTIRCPSFAEKPKAPSPRELSPQVTEGVFPPAGDRERSIYLLCEFQDTTRQLRCHPPRGGGHTVKLPATMPWVGKLRRARMKNSQNS